MSSEHLAYSRCSDVYLFSESMQARVAPQGLLSGLDEGCRRSAQHGCCSGIGPGGGGGEVPGAHAHMPPAATSELCASYGASQALLYL